MDKILQIFTQVVNFSNKLQQAATKLLRATKYLLADKPLHEEIRQECQQECKQATTNSEARKPSKAKGTKRIRQSRKV